MLRLELNVCRAELVHFSNLLLVAEPEREAVDDVWEEGAVVEAACAPGWFRVSGRGQRTCGAGGHWTNISLTCGKLEQDHSGQ